MQPVIVYPPTFDWDYLHQRPQQLLKALAELGCISVFCNINAYKQHPEGLISLSPNLFLANGLTFNTAVKTARKLYPGQPVLAYFTYPPHITQVQLPEVDLLLFDSVDEPAGEFSDWLPSYAQAVLNADIVTATARSLVVRASLLAREVYLIPNGCDYNHFKEAQTKQYIESTPFKPGRPIIGYIGSIAPWVDMPLVNTMARCLPDYEFVLIGPLLKQNWLALLSKNIHYLHHKAYSELPRYLSNFDYCLIPFRITDMTKGVNPIKFWEYLASGLPILSTPLPEIPPDFVTGITESMFPGFLPSPGKRSRAERIQLASDNSWKNRAVTLLEIISNKLACG
ncbi:glycosyltransferase [Sporomusa aerivorans]|uniref:glycosyltransferase n=1 Tax=Sporomusa aerivorans TaxID=204936 RepID=UPI003529E5F5